MGSRRPLVIVCIVAVVAAAFLVWRTLPRAPVRAAPAYAEPTVRPPAVAGAFYPDDPAQLRAQVSRYIAEAKQAPGDGDLVALIAPHAGYSYSGAVAGCAYRQLEGRHYDTVVVIGPAHQVAFRGFALSGADRWETPLGPVAIDREACNAIEQSLGEARVFDAAHAPEHSIEVQLPFLQVALGDFKLVPILMLDARMDACRRLAHALAEWSRGRSVLLVASSDMSHYPAYEDAVRVDHETLEAIQRLDAEALERVISRQMSQGVPHLETCLCGEGPVKTVLLAAAELGADTVRVLRYANSGDAPGASHSGVVGYGAVALYRAAGEQSGAAHGTAGELTAEQLQRLLDIARTTLDAFVTTGRAPDLALDREDQALRRPGAAFVTLTENQQLRGCIGSLTADAPLAETVRRMTVAAASQDRRFAPVQPSELRAIEIEVSVLSPLHKVSSPEEVVLGKHGVVVESQGRRGVFLPQVAEETGWSREQFLSHLCQDKAGLAPDAWKHGATLYVFTVQKAKSAGPGSPGSAHRGTRS